MKPKSQIILQFPRVLAALAGTFLTACNPVSSGYPASIAELRNSLRQSPTPRILWIGNSYSFGVPSQVQSQARQHGFRLECHQVTHSGWTLSRHFSSPETLQAIRSQRWDIVVLQEQSRRPSVPWRLRFQSLPAVASLAKEIRHVGAHPLLYQTWGYRDGDPSRKHDSYQKMNQRLRAGYQTLGKTLDIPVIPVGDAWEAALSAPNPPALFQPDGRHPSHLGDLLSSKAFINSILNQ